MTTGVRSYVRLFACATLLVASTAVDSSVPLGSAIDEVRTSAVHDTELRGDAGNSIGLFPKAENIDPASPSRTPMFIMREIE
jgi:hypothetical protein